MDESNLKGLSYNLSFEEYQDCPYLNHSSLRFLFPPNVPSDFLWWKNNPKQRTKAMDFGSAVHIAVFEHEIFDESVIVCPEIDKRTKAGKEEYSDFLKEAGNKIVLTQSELDSCYSIIYQIERHPILSKLVANKTANFESSGFFKYRDLDLKFRTDFIIQSHNLILDLKTTKAGHERAFKHSIMDFNYYSQAAFYLLGMSEITGEDWTNFIWIAIENNQPHKIYLYEPDTAWLIEGLRLINCAIDLYKDCLDKKFFPSVLPEVVTLSAPTYLGAK